MGKPHGRFMDGKGFAGFNAVERDISNKKRHK